MWFEFLTVVDRKIAVCWTVMLRRFLTNYCTARRHLSEVCCFPYLVYSLSNAYSILAD